MSKNKKGKVIQFQPISFERYVKENARKLPFSTCYIVGGEDNGIPQVIISRQKRNGSVIAGFYLVDKFCLGLKDSFATEFGDMDELRIEFFENNNLSHQAKEIDPIYAMNLIYGAIEYAEDAGFAPAKDFKLTEYILDDVEELEYIEIEFGRDGRYCFFEGPDDDAEKIIDTLEKNIGRGNFDFFTGGPDFFDDDDEDETKDLYDRFIDQIEEFEENVKDNMDFHLNILKDYEDTHGKQCLNTLMLNSFIAGGLLIEADLIENFKPLYFTNPSKIVEELKIKFYEKNIDSFSASKIDFKDFSVLPIDAIVFNNLVFGTYSWVYLPEHAELLKAIQSDQNITNSYYFDFIANVKERISYYYLGISIDIAQNDFNKDFIKLSKNHKEVTLLKAIEIFDKFYADIEIDDDSLYDLVNFSELTLIFDYYPRPTNEEILKSILDESKW